MDPASAPALTSPQLTATVELNELGLVLDSEQFAELFSILAMMRMGSRAQRVRTACMSAALERHVH